MQILDKDTFEAEVINAKGYILVDYFNSTLSQKFCTTLTFFNISILSIDVHG
jgi:hypothetical protein